VNILALVLVLPAAATCWLESVLSPDAEGVFVFWTQCVAVLPGHPGMYVRRAFYRLTLESSSLKCFIGFGALFAHRTAQVEDDVYIGPYTVIGSIRLRKGCLIGTRANLLSGSMQHVVGPDGGWQPGDPPYLAGIEIGQHAWIGEAALIMATVGEASVVSAGAVVSAPVAAGVVVAGNPARFVRRVRLETPPAETNPDERGRESFVSFIH